MTTEEKIKATIKTKIAEEAGEPLGFAKAQTMSGRLLDLTPPPLIVAVLEDGTVTLADFTDGAVWYKGRPQGPTLTQEPNLGRKDLSDDDKRRLNAQWDAALERAHYLKRGDVVIVVHAKDARVELREGPNFEPRAAS
jgi:hypothetical protein